MSEIEAKLVVFLKDSDLVASTAFITLAGKMGYGELLLGLKRFDYYRFTIGIAGREDPGLVLEELRKVLSSRSTFYNRNKHSYFLECCWGDGKKCFGSDLKNIMERMASEIAGSPGKESAADLDVQPPPERVILNKDSIFLGELLVTESNPLSREALGRKLESELAGRRVHFLDDGVLWWLAVKSPERSKAEEIMSEIAVSVRRDRGLLLNPNYQSYRLISVKKMALPLH